MKRFKLLKALFSVMILIYILTFILVSKTHGSKSENFLLLGPDLQEVEKMEFYSLERTTLSNLQCGHSNLVELK